MQHSLINLNQVRFHWIDFFDNPVCDDKLYIEVDNKTATPLQFKGTKCTLKSGVLTRRVLDSCTKYHMKNDSEWKLQSIDLQSLRKIYEVKRENGAIYKVKQDTVYVFPSYNHRHEIFAYSYPSSDEAILNEISPSLVQLE